eukprot:scaffold10279_cov80-Cylindrotheca_fusiformis.AAC.1
MAHPLYRFLSKKELFPKGSRLIDVVKSCEGDGYRAVKAILFKSHPAFYDQPSRLIAEYPKQRDLSILQYSLTIANFVPILRIILLPWTMTTRLTSLSIDPNILNT